MCSRGECVTNMGQWVQFQTQWGVHRGIVSDVNNRGVLMRVPRRYAPMGLATQTENGGTDEQKLDLALTYGRYGAGYGAGYGAYGRGYGRRWGYPGYGGWYGGWWWWWLAFAWIFWLAFLW